MRTASDRVVRSKGGTNTLSKNWKRSAKRSMGKLRRQAGKAQTAQGG